MNKVTTIVSDQVGRDACFCGADQRLVDDLGADSLDVVSITLDVETELAIELPERVVEDVETVGDLVAAAAVQLQVEVPS
jgi:acyl carrier protein